MLLRRNHFRLLPAAVLLFLSADAEDLFGWGDDALDMNFDSLVDDDAAHQAESSWSVFGDPRSVREIPADVIIPPQFGRGTPLLRAKVDNTLDGQTREVFAPQAASSPSAGDIVGRLGRAANEGLLSGPVEGIAQTWSRWSNLATSGWVNAANFFNNVNHRMLDRFVDVAALADRSGTAVATADVAVLSRALDTNMRWMEAMAALNERFLKAGTEIVSQAGDRFVEATARNMELPDLLNYVLNSDEHF